MTVFSFRGTILSDPQENPAMKRKNMTVLSFRGRYEERLDSSAGRSSLSMRGPRQDTVGPSASGPGAAALFAAHAAPALQ